MKALKRSLLFFVMACTLVLGVPGNVYAATIVASGSLGSGGTYELDSNQLLTISGTDTGTYTGGMNARSVVGRDFKAVRIKKGVTRVSDYTFMSTRLESVSFPVGLEQIGHESFIGTGLKNITLPKTVTFVNERAFDWGGLERVYFNGTQDEFEKVETVHNGSRMSLYTFIKTNYPSIRTGVIAGKTAPKDNSVKLKSIKLNMTKVTMTHNQQTQLELASYTPADATNLTLKWDTSNPLVATVSANGVVTCVGAGNAKITATTTDGSNKKATCTITGPKKASSVSLKPSTKKVAKDGLVTIEATVKPTGVIDDSVEWEPLTDNFEFVEKTARSCTLRCTGEGNLKVRAVSVNGSKKSTITITGPKKASSVSLKPDKKKLAKDEEAIIEATVNPKDAINKSVTWEPASDNFVFVEKGDTYCKIRCTDAGNIKVTAISVSNSKKKTITITGPKKGSSVSLKADKKLLPLNEQAVVTATVNPKDAIDRTVTWEPASDNAEIISYDGTTCTVKCKGEGNVKVKATSVSGNKSKTITISGPKPATSVSIKKSSYTLKVGEPVQATATVNPKNVIYNTVEWSSEDPSIATVTQDGVITAVAPGKTYIYAKAYNGKVGRCTVTVKE